MKSPLARTVTAASWVEKRGEVADLVCNSCGVVVDTVPIDRAGSRLMELASAEMCSAQCPHCGSLNTFPGFSAIDAFVCQECGEGVSIERAGAVIQPKPS